MIKKIFIFLGLFSTLFILISCNKTTEANNAIIIKDINGNTVSLSAKPERVIALQGNIAANYLKVGGSLVGVTSDYTNYNLDLDDIEHLGTNHKPNLELIVALNPDLVLYTSTFSDQILLTSHLKELNINVYDASVESFADYLYNLKEFSKLTEREDLYNLYGRDVSNKINKILLDVPTMSTYPSTIFIKASTSTLRAYADGNFVTDILDDLKINNLAKGDNSFLETLSLEAIVQKDPNYLLFSYMGSKEAAEDKIKASLTDNPAWKTLQAYKNDHIVILDSSLYQYKPNERWDEAYEFLFELFYS